MDYELINTDHNFGFVLIWVRHVIQASVKVSHGDIHAVRFITENMKDIQWHYFQMRL